MENKITPRMNEKKDLVARLLCTSKEERRVLRIADKINKEKLIWREDYDFLQEQFGYKLEADYNRQIKEFGYYDWKRSPNSHGYCLEEEARLKEELTQREPDWKAVLINIGLGVLEGFNGITCIGGLRFIPDYKPTYKIKSS